MPEPEFITIVEGPTPDFRPSNEFGIHSILEGPTDSVTAMCELRTLNGKSIVARCQQAWKEGRPVRLDFPDHMRMRQELDIAALRLSEIEEGPVLQVWVWQPALGQYEAEEEGDEDDDKFSY